jgi:hypothetical protein
MDNKLAKQILNEALNIAIARGCYGLVECSNIVKAIEYLNEQPDVDFGDVVEKEMD